MRRVWVVLLAGVAVGFVSSTLLSAAPQRRPAEKELVALVADFPPSDWTLQQTVVSGERKKHWARLLTEAPNSAEAVEASIALQQPPEKVLQAARRALDKQPSGARAVIDVLQRHALEFQMDGARDYRPAIREVETVARQRLAAIPREEAAQLALSLLRLDNYLERRQGEAFYAPMRNFATEYAGTAAADEAQLSLVSQSSSGRYDAVRDAAAYEAFAREHAGTCLAALALERVASYAQHGDQSGRTGEDPTERFLRAFEIARQLEGAEYAACDPKTDTVSIVAGLYAYQPKYSPENIDRLLAAYRDFVISHFGPDASDVHNGIGYAVLGKVGELCRLKGTGVEGLEAFLQDVETHVRDADIARYLRAMVPVLDPRMSIGSPAPSLTAVPARTVALLTEVRTAGSGVAARKALATLASYYRYFGDLAKAKQLYDEFAKSYPRSGYAWVAALRAGECAQEMGDWAGAAAAYQLTAKRYSTMPLARVIGHTWAARAFEALGQPKAALAEYQASIAGWDSSYGSSYSFPFTRRPVSGQPQTFEAANAAWTQTTTTLQDLSARVERLKKTTAGEGGEALERARWLIDQRKYKDGVAVLADFGQKYRRSPNAAEAQYLSHKARLYDALDTLNVEGEANEAAGVKALDALIAAPYDFPVCAAKIARAIVLFTKGKQQEADAGMRAALAEWVARNKTEQPATGIEKDVVAIRNLVFLPMGGAAYSQARGWNAFSWPATPPPFLVVKREVPVKLPGGRETRVSLAQRFPGLENVLQIDGDELGILGNIMNRLGGTKQREGKIFVDKGVMETPSVPVGPSVNIIRFLATFFEARPGHWGGWEFLTYPVVSQIEFMDAAGTKARAKVTIGYGGCDVLLEKVDGVWKTTGLTNMWVT